MGHPGLLCRLTDSSGYLGRDMLIMAGLAANQTTKRDHGGILSRLGQSASLGRYLKRSRNANDQDVRFPAPCAHQSIHSALQQTFGNEGIPPTHYDGKAHSLGFQLTFDGRRQRLAWLPQHEFVAAN